MATLWVGTTPASSCQLALSHWSRSVENTHLTPILITRLETSEGEGGVGTQVAAPLLIDLWRSTWICKDWLKQMLNDLLFSSRIHKDSQQEQQLIYKGLYKPRQVIRRTIKQFANMQARSHTSEGRGHIPWRPPHIVTHALWGYLLTPQNTTRD